MSRHGPASCCHCFECSWQRLRNCGNSRRGRDISCCFSTRVFTTLRARVVNVNGPYGPEVGNDSISDGRHAAHYEVMLFPSSSGGWPAPRRSLSLNNTFALIEGHPAGQQLEGY